MLKRRCDLIQGSPKRSIYSTKPSKDMKALYHVIDVNVYQENIFHTKMMLKDFDLKNYLFNARPDDLSADERKAITDLLYKKMHEIYYGRNLPVL